MLSICVPTASLEVLQAAKRSAPGEAGGLRVHLRECGLQQKSKGQEKAPARFNRRSLMQELPLGLSPRRTLLRSLASRVPACRQPKLNHSHLGPQAVH